MADVFPVEKVLSVIPTLSKIDQFVLKKYYGIGEEPTSLRLIGFEFSKFKGRSHAVSRQRVHQIRTHAEKKAMDRAIGRWCGTCKKMQKVLGKASGRDEVRCASCDEMLPEDPGVPNN